MTIPRPCTYTKTHFEHHTKPSEGKEKKKKKNMKTPNNATPLSPQNNPPTAPVTKRPPPPFPQSIYEKRKRHYGIPR